MKNKNMILNVLVIANGSKLIKDITVRIVNILFINRNFKLIWKYLDRWIFFLEDYHMLKKIKRYIVFYDNKFKTKEEMVNKLRSLKVNTKNKISSKYFFDQMNYMRQSNTFVFEDPLAKNIQGIGMIMNESLLIMIFLQAKPQMKNKTINSYD